MNIIDLDKYMANLSIKGYRITPLRRALLQQFEMNCHPIRVTDLIKKLKPYHKTSIYRDLEVYINEGIIRETNLDDQSAMYEIDQNHHHHTVCTNCSKIGVLSCNGNMAQFESDALIQNQFQTQNHQLTLYGLCASCA